MEGVHKISCIIETLFKKFPCIFAIHINLFTQKISPSAISNFFTWAMNRKIRSMDLLWANPKNVLLIIFKVSDSFDSLISCGKLNGWIFFKLKLFGVRLKFFFFIFLDWELFVVHLIDKSFNYIQYNNFFY